MCDLLKIFRERSQNTKKKYEEPLLETDNKAEINQGLLLKTYPMEKYPKLGIAVIFNNFEFDPSK